jgi:hypothetical protein
VPKKSKNEEVKVVQRKDKTIKIPRLFEFQFFENFEELQALARRIKGMQDNMQTVPEDDKEHFRELASTGFINWT